jgi:hypothetical protein
MIAGWARGFQQCDGGIRWSSPTGVLVGPLVINRSGPCKSWIKVKNPKSAAYMRIIDGAC